MLILVFVFRLKFFRISRGEEKRHIALEFLEKEDEICLQGRMTFKVSEKKRVKMKTKHTGVDFVDLFLFL